MSYNFDERQRQKLVDKSRWCDKRCSGAITHLGGLRQVARLKAGFDRESIPITYTGKLSRQLTPETVTEDLPSLQEREREVLGEYSWGGFGVISAAQADNSVWISNLGCARYPSIRQIVTTPTPIQHVVTIPANLDPSIYHHQCHSLLTYIPKKIRSDFQL